MRIGLIRRRRHALVFVARRLLVDSVALMFVARDPSDELQGFQELVVEGLGDGDARALLSSAVRVPLDEAGAGAVGSRETRGNPLALLELPRGLTPAELAGGFGLLDTPGLSGRIEDRFRAGSRGSGGYSAAVVGRGGGAGRRPRAGVARGRRLGIAVEASIEDRWVARDWRQRDVSSPAGPLIGVPSRLARGQAGCASRAGRRRPIPRSIPIAAPGISPKRRRGRTRTSRPSSSARRAALRLAGPGGRGRIFGACHGADPRALAPRWAGARRRTGQAPGPAR